MFANATSYSALVVPFFDERGVDVVVVLAKATFVRRGSKLVLADDQAPVRMADVPTNPNVVAEGRESSIRYPSDMGGEKPGADIVVVGNAVSQRLVPSIDVAVKAPGRTVALRVHGERVFYKGALGLKVSPAAPFERAPITYERAYGGASRDRSIIDWRNPVGRGVHESAAELDGEPAPCIEDPAHPIEGTRETTPVGFGAIPVWWLPRRDLSGTMDAAWQAERMPLPPVDFDRRFHHLAHPSLQLNRPLREGDVIATRGLCEDVLFDVTVPALPVIAHTRRSSGPPVSLPLALDTALLEPEASRVELTFRRVVPLGRGKTLLREVRLDVDA
ncbi:DUF2169 family type VI secretion system accessory protein [Sorangium sp. So ce1151]|uniref:DUF2169 family type VI secretion system accessory protein n=1 Tax=Sorangium sp. So ce1151 TaxID=3133332 RepID=UPI003F5FB0DF